MTINVGFTGTQNGCTNPQRTTLAEVLSSARAQASHLHHGDCIGADDQAHLIWKALGGFTIIHPPEDVRKRAWCLGDVVLPPLPYIERNHNIVEATQVLIATPKGLTEEQRSGTWATIRYARKQMRPICIIFPDGSYSTEGKWQLSL